MSAALKIVSGIITPSSAKVKGKIEQQIAQAIARIPDRGLSADSSTVASSSETARATKVEIDAHSGLAIPIRFGSFGPLVPIVGRTLVGQNLKDTHQHQQSQDARDNCHVFAVHRLSSAAGLGSSHREDS